jgi:hypothetical protein
MPSPLLMFRCCEHCGPDIIDGTHDLPHKTACDYGCNDDEFPDEVLDA